MRALPASKQHLLRHLRSLLLSLATLALLAGCSADSPPVAAAADATEWPLPTPPLRATHWFGEHWAKNLINAFRREDVPAEFAQIREDGFDTVILVVSWADFQPVFDPCCGYDERAFERLRFLVDEAERQHLRVMLRVGYAWGFHPDSPPTLERVHRLMNEPEARRAFLALVDRIAADIRGRPHVLMSFMSWEDQWLRRIEPHAAADYASIVATLPAAEQPRDLTRLPSADGEDAEAFNRYWDELMMASLHAPAQQLIPNLGYEVRIDKEPLWGTDASGSHSVLRWIDHRRMYQPAGPAPLVLYWAPYWGAQNVGERLVAEQSLPLLANMLAEAAAWSGSRPSFINQFNLIDNTPGHEQNAALADAEIPEFLRGAVCVLKDAGVLGIGLWTGRDYVESPLYNPGFAYGLEGWTLTDASGHLRDPAVALLTAADRDPWLAMQEGDVLAQEFGTERGRLPHRDDRPDEACVDARSENGAQLALRAGDGEVTPLVLPVGHVGRACTAIDSKPLGERLRLTVTLAEGSAALRGLWLFDHVQDGAVRRVDGSPGRHHAAFRDFNAAMARSELPEDCRR